MKCTACGGSGSRITDRNGQPAMELRCTVCGGSGRKEGVSKVLTPGARCMHNTYMETTATTKCHSCQTQDKMDRGEEVTQQERNAWSMWGCFCDKSAAEVAEVAAEHHRNHG